MDEKDESWLRIVALVVAPYLLIDAMVITTGVFLDRLIFNREIIASIRKLKNLRSPDNDSLVRPYAIGCVFYLIVLALLMMRFATL